VFELREVRKEHLHNLDHDNDPHDNDNHDDEDLPHVASWSVPVDRSYSSRLTVPRCIKLEVLGSTLVHNLQGRPLLPNEGQRRELLRAER